MKISPQSSAWYLARHGYMITRESLSGCPRCGRSHTVRHRVLDGIDIGVGSIPCETIDSCTKCGMQWNHWAWGHFHEEPPWWYYIKTWNDLVNFVKMNKRFLLRMPWSAIKWTAIRIFNQFMAFHFTRELQRSFEPLRHADPAETIDAAANGDDDLPF